VDLAGAHNLALFIHRAVRLAEAHGKDASWLRRELSRMARLGWAGARTGFGLSRFATPFMNNPG